MDEETKNATWTLTYKALWKLHVERLQEIDDLEKLIRNIKGCSHEGCRGVMKWGKCTRCKDEEVK